jgi:hypothetical protein
VSRPTPFIAAALATLLGGCGSSGEPVRARDGVVELRLVDFRIKPIVVRAPRDSLTILVRNEGRLAHALRIRGATEVTRLKVTTLKPGAEAARVGVTLKRGRWRMFCPIANHEELGMHATLEVR